MWLRNFDNYMLICAGLYATMSGYISSGVSINGTTNFGDGYVNIKCPNGTIKAITPAKSGLYTPASCAQNNIVLGNGTTAVTYDDFKLSGDVIASNSELSVAHPSREYDSANKKYKRVTTVTYTNANESAVTISEYGIYITNSTTASATTYPYSNNTTNVVLLYREVLSSPVEVAAGETVTLSLKLDFPMPNHP